MPMASRAPWRPTCDTACDRAAQLGRGSARAQPNGCDMQYRRSVMRRQLPCDVADAELCAQLGLEGRLQRGRIHVVNAAQHQSVDVHHDAVHESSSLAQDTRSSNAR